MIDVEITSHRIDYIGRNAVLVVAQDITERKQAEKALRESESSLRQAQAIAHIGHWTWDTETNVVRWSDEMYRIFGVDRNDFIGDLNTIIQTAVHPDDRAMIIQLNKNAVTKSELGMSNYRIVRSDGEVRHVRGVIGERITNANGNNILLQVLFKI